MRKQASIFTTLVVIVVTVLALVSFILIAQAPVINATIICLLCGFVVLTLVIIIINDKKAKSLLNAFVKFADATKHNNKDK